MNEGDFDKKISKKLNNDENYYPNMDKNWKKIVEKMENPKPISSVLVLPHSEKGQSNNTYRGNLLLLLGLLMLLGSNSWLGWRLWQKNEATENNLYANRIAPQTIYVYDTIIETKVIYKIDTVYKKVILFEPIKASTMSSIGSKLYPTSTLLSKHDATHLQTNSALNGLSLNEQNGFQQKQKMLKNEQNTSKNDKKSEITSKKPIEPNNSENLKLLEDNSLLSSKVQTDSLKNSEPSKALVKTASIPSNALNATPEQNLKDNIIKISRKKWVVNHYSIGAERGLSFEQPNLKDVTTGQLTGLTGEMAFNSSFRFSISGQYSFLSYKTLTRSPMLDLPPTPIIKDDFSLKYIEGASSNISASVGISYFLKPKSRISPFLTLGYAHTWSLPNEIEFEFMNKQTPDEKSFILNSLPHQDNRFLLGVGLEMPLVANIFGQLNAQYVYDLNHGRSPLSYILLRGGIFYRF